MTKVETTPEPDVRTAQAPSGTTLLGLLKHFAHVEEAIFLGHRTTSWPATFGCTDLSGPVPHGSTDRLGPSTRWALAHMIEETGTLGKRTSCAS